MVKGRVRARTPRNRSRNRFSSFHGWFRDSATGCSGKRVRAAVFAAVVTASFITGVLLHGEIAVPQQDSPLSWFFTFGCIGNGMLYFVRLLWVNGFDGLFSASFPYGLSGGGDPVAAGFFYGKTFLYTAGLMNLLVVLDVHDIARGDKS